MEVVGKTTKADLEFKGHGQTRRTFGFLQEKKVLELDVQEPDAQKRLRNAQDLKKAKVEEDQD